MFCIGLLIGGVWLSRRERLESMLWIVPGASVVAVGALGLMGMRARQGMQDTVSVLQLVNLDVAQDDVPITGMAALYQRDKSEATLGGTATGMVKPERFSGDGSLRRLLWTSDNRWRWQSLPLAAGLRFAPFRCETTMKQPARMTGSFGPEGFLGVLDTGSFENVSDLLIVTPTQHTLALAAEEGGRLIGGRTQVQEPGQIISAALLSDEQRRRQDVVRELLSATYRERKYPEEPTLIVWADPLETGFELADHVNYSGAALVTLPIQWDRPQPGTRVMIPSPFLSYESVASKTIGVTTAYDRHSGLWRKSGSGKQALLRFQLPEVVLPMEIESATMTVDISAASRIVNVSMGRSEGLHPVARWESPLGTLPVEVDDPQALQLDDAGGLHVLIDVGQVTFKEGDEVNITREQENWLIHSLQLELTGRIPAGDSDQ